MTSSDNVLVVSDQEAMIYTWVVYAFACQIINVVGIATNSINIVCFVKQGFQDSVNISLLGLSVSDLGSLLTMMWTCVCITPAVVTADLPFDPVEVLYVTSAMAHLSFTRVSSCITAMITLERCLCITAPLHIKTIITPKRMIVINVCIFIINFCTSAPVYAVNKLDMKFSITRNKTIFGLLSTKNREHVEKISFAINNFAIPFCAFVIIVVCTTTLSLKLHSSNKWRQLTNTSTNIDKVSSRNQKTAKMVVMICTLFILCFVPMNIIMLALGILPELSVNGRYYNLSVTIAGIGYLLENINASSNIFIYYKLSSKYRECMYTMFCASKSSEKRKY